MNKEWISGSEGRNLKFKRETLLNYDLNRQWCQLNFQITLLTLFEYFRFPFFILS